MSDNGKEKCQLSLVIPSYREAEALELMLPRINEVLNTLAVQSEVLIIDTINPTDATEAVCSKNNVTYVNRVGGDCYGDAIRTGIVLAKGDYILVMDADGSHDPSYMLEFWPLRDKYDIVIGSRYTAGGKTDNPYYLVFMSYMVNLAFRIILGLPYKDISNSFRLYRANVLKRISLKCDNFDIVEEILVKCVCTSIKAKCVEVPIVFKKRLKGETKRNLFLFMISYVYTLFRLYSYRIMG